MIDHYDWPGGREAMLRFGPADGPVVIAALPLFEEANRTRAFVVTILRALGRQGFSALLPDLPGTGESVVATSAARLADWRAAFASAAGGGAHAISLRGGALIPGGSLRSHWQLSPLDGDAQHRELMRLKAAGSDDALIAGNAIDPSLLEEIATATAAEKLPARVVRLDSDPRDADLKLTGGPLWRRTEPDNDIVLAEILANDIVAWVRACVS